MSAGEAPPASMLVGIMIGGASRRMGRTKGLLLVPSESSTDTPHRDSSSAESTSEDRLASRKEEPRLVEGGDAPPAPRETIVARTLRIVRQALPEASIGLVGDREEFDDLALERIRDARENCGPLGGIVSLLQAASKRGFSAALALGSDFPFLSESLVRRLAREAPDALILAPLVDDRYQPLVARYAVGALPEFELALAGEQFGLQKILRKLGAASLAREEGDLEALTDWDTPEDMARSRKL